MKGMARRKTTIKYKIEDGYRLLDLDQNYPIFDRIDSYNATEVLIWRTWDFMPSRKLYDKSFATDISLRAKANITFNLY